MSRWMLAGLTIAALVLASCADSERFADLLSPDGSPSSSLGPGQVDERAALEELTQSLALALHDVGLRQRVRADLWKSHFTAEHKLPLRDYLQGESGGILLAKMVSASGKSREEITSLIASVRPLEFYMPNPDHRAEWTGEEEVVVGSQLEEGDVPSFYGIDGAPYFVGPNDFPDRPTLSLVPVESDFSAPLDPARYENRGDQNGATIGTYRLARTSVGPVETTGTVEIAEECDSDVVIIECPDPGSGSMWHPPADAVYVRGIGVQEYISYIYAVNDHEPDIRGAPEFSILLAATSDTDSGAELSKELNVPEGVWDGSDDDHNKEPRFWNQKLILWDIDYGTHVRVQCWERDAPWDFNFSVSGSTEIFGIDVGFSATFQREDSDDPCGTDYIRPRLSTGVWLEIPQEPKDASDDGTTDLKWYGYGLDVTA